MKLTYWIWEPSERGQVLRANTREEFGEFIRKNDLRAFVQTHYDLPREITVNCDNIHEVIKLCMASESYTLLPWEKIRR